MSFETWTLFTLTVLVFMGTPGPSHLLMLSVSIGNGFRRSLATAAGDLSANAIQITLAGLGLAAVLTASGAGLRVVKWLGVAYLSWMGIRQIVRSFTAGAQPGRVAPATLTSLWLRGFVTSAANPKAIVFFAALLPQFIEDSAPLAPQLLVLGATYIAIDGLFLCTYGKGASWLASRMTTRTRAWTDRAAGAGLVGAAVLLGLKEHRPT